VFRMALTKSVAFRYGIDRRTYQRAGQRHHVERLGEIWSGKPALIVANGPSLNRTPLDEFSGVPSIGMNKIDLIYSRVRWRPDFVVCSNNLVASQNQDAWIAAGVPVFLS